MCPSGRPYRVSGSARRRVSAGPCACGGLARDLGPADDGDSDKNEGDSGNELPREKEGAGDAGSQGDFQKRSRAKMQEENT